MPYISEYVAPDHLADKDGVIILQSYRDGDYTSPERFYVNVYYEPGKHSDLYAVETEGKKYDIVLLPGYQVGWHLPVWECKNSPVCKWLQSLLEDGTITQEWDTVEFPE